MKTPRGMRDFMPEEMRLRADVIARVKKVYEKFGFEPLETPALEELAVLGAKQAGGDEVEKQIFKVEGGLGLRFDLTVPLARVVAGNRTLPKPFKRYCIGPVWRREEPQRLRFREFWQADVDTMGSASMSADAEILACASACLKELGFSEFLVRVSNRKILDGLIERIKAKGSRVAIFRAIDKLSKIGEAGVREELAKIGLEPKSADDVISFTKITGSNEEKLSKVEKLVSGSKTGAEGVQELKEILEFSKAYGTDIVLDLSLARGLDYYTGPVFEITTIGKISESVYGGGRYDNLIKLYGGEATPATGISLGIERVIEMIKERKGGKEKEGVFVANTEEKFYKNAIKTASELRQAGISASVDLMGRNLKKQFEYANARSFRFVAIIGEREVKEGKLKIRDMESGDEKLLAFKEALSWIGGKK